MNQRKGRAVGELPDMPLQLPKLRAERRLCVLRERLPAEDEDRIFEKRRRVAATVSGVSGSERSRALISTAPASERDVRV